MLTYGENKLDAEKYNRQITLRCPTCGGTQFEHDDENNDDNKVFKCASCQREITKAELLRENEENISAHVDEVKKEIAEDVKKEIRKAFSGLGNLKIKL
jgi:DNA-directed RNA polymerase subunit RPC12/RpoP